MTRSISSVNARRRDSINVASQKVHDKKDKTEQMGHTRANFLRFIVLQVLAALSQILAGVVTIILSPYRAYWVYGLWMLVCTLKLLVAVAGGLDLLLNLVETRPIGRQLMRALVGVRAGEWLQSLAGGRGAYVPMTATQLLSEIFYGFPTGTFMVSYNWGHPTLPRRIAQELLPEKPTMELNKCWLDIEQARISPTPPPTPATPPPTPADPPPSMPSSDARSWHCAEQLIPGTMITSACHAAVTAARFVFVFLTPAYMRSKNCRAELKALLAKPDCASRAIIYEYTDEPRSDEAESGVLTSDEVAALRSIPVRRIASHRAMSYDSHELLNDLAHTKARISRSLPQSLTAFTCRPLLPPCLAALSCPLVLPPCLAISRLVLPSPALSCRLPPCLAALSCHLPPCLAISHLVLPSPALSCHLPPCPTVLSPSPPQALRYLLRERSPRINAQWLATASLLCEPRSYVRSHVRFAHVWLLPIVLNALLYLGMLYIASERLTLFELEDSLASNIRSDCADECASACPLPINYSNVIAAAAAATPTPRTAQAVTAGLCFSVFVELLLIFWALFALPKTQRPWTSTLRTMPDAGLLLLVLRKLHVIDAPVRVINLSSDDTISGALGTLETHGVVTMVSGVAASYSRILDSRTLLVLDLDTNKPTSLAPMTTQDYVAWSASEGFGRLTSGGWADAHPPLGASIVAQPQASRLMLETILCRILSLALSDGPECILSAGGRFEVDAEKLHVGAAVKVPLEGSFFRSKAKPAAAAAKLMAGKMNVQSPEEKNSRRRRGLANRLLATPAAASPGIGDASAVAMTHMDDKEGNVRGEDEWPNDTKWNRRDAPPPQLRKTAGLTTHNGIVTGIPVCSSGAAGAASTPSPYYQKRKRRHATRSPVRRPQISDMTAHVDEMRAESRQILATLQSLSASPREQQADALNA